MDSTTYRIPVSGQAMSVVDGSELAQRPEQYDGVGSKAARDACEALRTAERRRAGRGVSYIVTVSREGAAALGDYCWTVGETFAGESEPESRADGRALLIVGERIGRLLELGPRGMRAVLDESVREATR